MEWQLVIASLIGVILGVILGGALVFRLKEKESEDDDS